MIVAHLIGGNEVIGIKNGTVIINDETLKVSYEELAIVCGSISLGDLNTNTDTFRSEDDVQNDYIQLVKNYNDELSDEFVVDNHLTKEVCYSTYEIDVENKTLLLKIDTFN